MCLVWGEFVVSVMVSEAREMATALWSRAASTTTTEAAAAWRRCRCRRQRHRGSEGTRIDSCRDQVMACDDGSVGGAAESLCHHDVDAVALVVVDDGRRTATWQRRRQDGGRSLAHRRWLRTSRQSSYRMARHLAHPMAVAVARVAAAVAVVAAVVAAGHERRTAPCLLVCGPSSWPWCQLPAQRHHPSS